MYDQADLLQRGKNKFNKKAYTFMTTQVVLQLGKVIVCKTADVRTPAMEYVLCDVP